MIRKAIPVHVNGLYFLQSARMIKSIPFFLQYQQQHDNQDQVLIQSSVYDWIIANHMIKKSQEKKHEHAA
jgi:hypothetical protein